MAPTRLCSIPECGKRHEARGLCRAHYWRWKQHGDPLAGRTPVGMPERFFVTALESTTDRCIFWPYQKTADGYAKIYYQGKTRVAARLMCKLAHGQPPPNHEAAHSCGNGNQGCINPRHLRWATPKENSADMIRHGRSCRGTRHRNVRLTEVDVRRIRTLSATHGQQALAVMFAVNHATISDILRKKRWAWLD